MTSPIFEGLGVPAPPKVARERGRIDLRGGTFYAGPMASSRARSAAATVLGWIIFAIVAWMLLGWVFATLRWVLRTVLILVVLGVLVSLYARLSDG